MNATAQQALETALANDTAALAQSEQRRQEMAVDLATQDASIVVLQGRCADLQAALDALEPPVPEVTG